MEDIDMSRTIEDKVAVMLAYANGKAIEWKTRHFLTGILNGFMTLSHHGTGLVLIIEYVPRSK